MPAVPGPAANSRVPSDAVPSDPPSGDLALAVLVPVKAFDQAKGRLARVLSPSQRAALARDMATNVVRAGQGLAVSVVCDDLAVAEWARSVGAAVLWCPGRGLDQAVSDGMAALGASGFGRVIVAHSDLPLAESLGWVGAFDGITIVPDRREDGTNVICVPTAVPFTFAYGPASFARHRAEARRLGLALRVVRDRRLGFDVDTPEDLQELNQPDGDDPRTTPSP